MCALHAGLVVRVRWWRDCVMRYFRCLLLSSLHTTPAPRRALNPKPCAAPDGSKGMPRVGSMGSLALSGGSTPQLLASFVAKTLCLCVVVFLSAGVELPRLLEEINYCTP